MVKGKKPNNKQKGAGKKVVKKAKKQVGKGILGDIVSGLTFGLVPRNLIPI